MWDEPQQIVVRRHERDTLVTFGEKRARGSEGKRGAGLAPLLALREKRGRREDVVGEMWGEEDVVERQSDDGSIISLERKKNFPDTRGHEGLSVGEADNLAARSEGGEESTRPHTMIGGARVHQESIACCGLGVDDGEPGLERGRGRKLRRCRRKRGLVSLNMVERSSIVATRKRSIASFSSSAVLVATARRGFTSSRTGRCIARGSSTIAAAASSTPAMRSSSCGAIASSRTSTRMTTATTATTASCRSTSSREKGAVDLFYGGK
jgi:hypothetical protein